MAAALYQEIEEVITIQNLDKGAVTVQDIVTHP